MIIRNKKYGTYPSLIHVPLRNKTWNNWANIRSIYFAEPKQNIDLKDLTIITWNNSNNKGVFEQSLDHLGLKYLVLGRDTKNWQNIVKINLTRNALENITTEYVLGSDSFDSILLNDPAKIIEGFLKTGLEICYNGGSGNHGLVSSIACENKAYREYDIRHVAAGTFIGKTKFCKQFFEIACDAIPLVKKIISYSNNEKYTEEHMNSSDDFLMKAIAPMFFGKLGIDHLCKFFMVVNSVNDLEVV